MALILALAIATPALADPCEAVPEKGPTPAHLTRGSGFNGKVVYIGDGDSLCVATGLGPANWVEVRIADFYAPELSAPGGEAAKRTLKRIAMGRQAYCAAEKRSYDRIVARCLIDGRSVGDRMRDAGIIEGGRGR